MTLPNDLNTRRYRSYIDAGNNKTAVMTNNSEFLGSKLETSVTFVAGTTGSVASHTLLTVTGTVALSIIGVCGTNLAGASATIEVGTAATTAGLIAQTTATNIDANEIWHDASPDASVELTSVVKKNIVSDNVIYKVTTAAISAGKITFYIFWEPISSDGNVTVA